MAVAVVKDVKDVSHQEQARAAACSAGGCRYILHGALSDGEQRYIQEVKTMMGLGFEMCTQKSLGMPITDGNRPHKSFRVGSCRMQSKAPLPLSY